MNKQYFITGIGTDVGKTVVSAIVAEALKASYWKPIQSGGLDHKDSDFVVSNTSSVIRIDESILLNEPLSPHAAARIDGRVVPNTLELPKVSGNLVVEGAGGLMVPLNDAGACIIDWITHWSIPVILVSRHYLGSINHTLLSVEALKNRNIPIHGIMFVGDENRDSEEIIERISGCKIVGRIPLAQQLNKQFVIEQSEKIKDQL